MHDIPNTTGLPVAAASQYCRGQPVEVQALWCGDSIGRTVHHIHSWRREGREADFTGLHKSLGVVATPHGVLPRDSHQVVSTLGGGTQDTDFNKGFTKGIFTRIFGEEMGGVRGTQTPL